VNKEAELWYFIVDRLDRGENVMLLLVGESSGSSPGRAGYKMAVGADGELVGSIGGGVMEINLVEQSRRLLSGPGAVETGSSVEQVHRQTAPNASGMICSGKQTVIFKRLTPKDIDEVRSAISSLKDHRRLRLTITPDTIAMSSGNSEAANIVFERFTDSDFEYCERLGPKNDLCIVGGGHCALALSELMSKMDFYIRLFDDRPQLNTLEKNRFAHEINILENYNAISELILPGPNVYVVVMTLGYETDKTVIRALLARQFRYLGVLGSEAKMKIVMRDLEEEGFPTQHLERIRTPIGLPINSHTPEEIAVSIAAEIIAVKNST
jgi:xanthine dehydrogenase accessory factor